MSRYWTCSRVTAGVRCGRQNLARKRKCVWCGKPRPVKRRPAHMAALDLPYEDFVALNGGDFCALCRVAPAPGKHLNRDHDHKTGKPRGLLCWKCNKYLHGWMTDAWLRRAVAYVNRGGQVEREGEAA